MVRLTKYYYCNSCGEFFDEDEAARIAEYHPEVHENEYFIGCPVCGSDDLEERDPDDEDDEIEDDEIKDDDEAGR